ANRELLLVDVVPPVDLHPGPLVEPGRAGRVLRIDSERHSALAAPGKDRERLEQKREAEAATPPGRPDADVVDVADATARRTGCEARDLLPVERHDPQLRIEALTLDPVPAPRLELAADESPLVGERLHDRGMDGALALGRDPRQPDAFRRLRLGRR